jgi:hypothetical protein
MVRAVRGYTSLYLMLQSIKGSVSALGWSSAVLLLGEMMFALALNLLLREYWEDQDSESWDLSDRKQLYEYFGTFSRSLLTMLEMLMGNWFEVTRFLTRFDELFMVFGVCHQLTFGFAVLEVISGVFLNETFEVAALDDGIMLNEARGAAKAERTKLTEFFRRFERDGNDKVSFEELEKVLEDEEVRDWLDAMGLDFANGRLRNVFKVLDKTHDGWITCEELLESASMLKKPARAVDLVFLQKTFEQMWQMNLDEGKQRRRSTIHDVS